MKNDDCRNTIIVELGKRPGMKNLPAKSNADLIKLGAASDKPKPAKKKSWLRRTVNKVKKW